MKLIGIIKFTTVTILLGLTACGGGGGGGSTPSSHANASSTQVITSSFSSHSSVPNLASIAKIQFPRQDAKALTGRSSILVTGIAYDDKGIRQVKVNGVNAALNKEPISKSTDIPETHSAGTGWAATIELAPGNNQVLVEITDSDGLVVRDGADSLNIHNINVPVGMVLDPVNDRMIGFATYGQNYSINLETLDTSFTSNARLYQGLVINHESTEIYSSSVEDGIYKLLSNRIGSNIQSIVASYDLGFDPLKHLWIDFASGAMSPNSQYYYASVRYVFQQNIEPSVVTKILKIEVSSGKVGVLTETGLHVNYPYMSNLFYWGNALFAIALKSNDASFYLVKINAETGSTETVMIVPSALGFSLDMTAGILYGTAVDKLIAINLTEKTVTEKEWPEQGQEFELTDFGILLFDQKRNRLISPNSGHNETIAIDAATGERSLLTKNRIGEGVSMVTPLYMEVTADDKFAYIFDDRLHATDTIFKVDLATGNRTVISDLRAYDNFGIYGLALDELNNRLFFAVGLNIGVIDLATGTQTIIASPTVGLGIAMESFISIGDMIYDGQNNRLLVSSGWINGFVAAIDPITLRRTLLLDSMKGNGPTLASISAMALDMENGKLYVANTDPANKASIMAINIETGDRDFLFDQCEGRSLADIYGAQIMLDKKNRQLYVTGNNEILVRSLTDNNCKIINSPVNDVALMSDSTLLGVSLGLVQVHPGTGERAIISR